MRPTRWMITLALFAAAAPATASGQVTLELFGGTSVDAPLPVSVALHHNPDLRWNPRFRNFPFKETWYYAGRIGFWKRNRGWLVDFTHHKLYATRLPSEVQEFKITNGFNMITLSRGWRRGNLVYSLGAGAVITYPRVRIHDQQIDGDRGFIFEGYFLSGATVMATVSRRFYLVPEAVFLSLDLRGSASYVRIPVADGHAGVPNLALHLHAGFGMELRGRRKPRGKD